MCSRYNLHNQALNVAIKFGAQLTASAHAAGVRESAAGYNIAPEDALVIVMENGERVLKTMRFGLIPAYTPIVKSPTAYVNARCETVDKRPAFRDAFHRRRCLVIMDDFTEGEKRPHLIRRKDGQSIATAGLWEIWHAPFGPVATCAIITVPANRMIAPIHHRMPALLDPEAQDIWLDHTTFDRDRLLNLLSPYEGPDLEMTPLAIEIEPTKPRRRSRKETVSDSSDLNLCLFD